MHRIAVFASGEGSNFEAIVAASERGDLDCRVVLLVCDRVSARVVERAAHHGIECFAFLAGDYSSKEEYEAEIVKRLDAHRVELVCLAGYMRIVGSRLLASYEGRIINLHPSLLPAFKGKDAIGQALDYGVKIFGVSIHWVDSSLDGGRIIAQRAFAYEGSDREELERKIHEAEHPLYVETIGKILNKEIQ